MPPVSKTGAPDPKRVVDPLNDELNLRLLKNICSGNGLDVNLSYLSRHLRRHRNSVRERVRNLLSHRIIDRPIFPFFGLFREYPLLVAAYADIPDSERINEWLRNDRNVFAAFRVREGEYNIMLFEFHQSVWNYHMWRDALVLENKIPRRGERAPSTVYYFANQLIEKYDPTAGAALIEGEFRNRAKMDINGYIMDRLALQVLQHLVNGEGIKVNENLLSKELNIHRRTIAKRISKLQEAGLILDPCCRFPSFFVPPNFLLVFSMVEIKSSREQIIRDIKQDPHVSLAYRISEGRFNTLLFESHLSIEDHLIWEKEYSDRYPGCFGSTKINYLSPRMTISIDQQKVSLGIIEKKLKEVE
jgi:DNA-binding Lrp family transcriptional regulator